MALRRGHGLRANARSIVARGVGLLAALTACDGDSNNVAPTHGNDGFAENRDREWGWRNPSLTFDDFRDICFLGGGAGVAVGGNGMIMRTTDGGASWERVLSGAHPGLPLHAVHFVNDAVGIAVGSGIVVKSTDGGLTWNVLTSAPDEVFQGVFFVDENIGMAVGQPAVIYRTEDGGETWTQQTPPVAPFVFDDVHLTDADTGTIVGFEGVILRTANGGQTWRQQTSGTTQNLKAVHFVSEDVGVAVGYGAVLRTTDGGGVWESLPTPAWSHYDIAFFNAEVGIIVGDEVLYTDDRGASWASRDVGQVGSYVDFSDLRSLTAVGSRGSVMRSTDSGVTWTSYSSDVTEMDLFAVSLGTSLDGIAVGTSGAVVTTSDGGHSWTTQSSGVTDDLYDVFGMGATHAWAVGENGRILRTANGGDTWAPQSSGTGADLWGVWFSSPSVGTVVGSDGVILRTTNGGSTWTPQSHPAGTVRFGDVCFSSDSTGVIVGGAVLTTTDGGATWVERDTDLPEALRDVVFADASTVFGVGYDGFIARSTDAGITWSVQTYEEVDDNLTSIHFADANTGTAVGEGVIFDTTDRGATWTVEPHPAQEYISSVWLPGTGSGIVVGEYGQILGTDEH